MREEIVYNGHVLCDFYSLLRRVLSGRGEQFAIRRTCGVEEEGVKTEEMKEMAGETGKRIDLGSCIDIEESNERNEDVFTILPFLTFGIFWEESERHVFNHFQLYIVLP